MLFPVIETPYRRITQPALPGWVSAMLATARIGSASKREAAGNWEFSQSGPWSVVAVRVAEAAGMEPQSLQEAVSAAYGQALRIVRDHGDAQPARFWNYVPRLLAEAGPGRDRYMVFNAGRQHAFEQHYGKAQIARGLVAASAVDSSGADFHLHVLAFDGELRALENPRQRPAYRYSKRYGPVPPSFARATMIEPVQPGEPRRLISAGTASVLGEASHHQGNLSQQLRETEINLAVLIALASVTDESVDVAAIEQSPSVRRELLSACRHVRGYVAAHEHEESVRSSLAQTFIGAKSIEIMPAALCRRELLVEIEVMAELDHATGSAKSLQK